jgi:chemotaxis protein methyltransferase CheR
MYGSAATERFRSWIAQRLGLHFDDTKLEFLAELLGRHADREGLPPQRYLDRLENPDSPAELRKLAFELTVPETYFFRHIDQLHAFAEVAIPNARAALGSSRRLNVLSAGCASGEEPYSLAMLLRERSADHAGHTAIHAVDINASMLAKAARGRYSPWALRETPPNFQQRWFRSAGRDFVLDESIRNAVTFREGNLAEDNPELWIPEFYDVIFCRNVLMYFTPECAQTLVARLTRSLAPGGHLFLGHAETLRGLSHDYHLRHTHNTFYYQRKDARTEWVSVAEAAAWDTTWPQSVERASDRIRALTERPPVTETQQRGGSDTAHAVQTVRPLQLVLEQLKEERFADALELLSRLPAESVHDPDVLLLRAALLTHSGQLSTAENVSAQLLERDELNTGAHYLLALCRESAGDRQGAHDHDQTAVYLDPGFAMPRLHLGLMARRAGDMEAARHELGQALMLLKREDASRLLLFGGGFGREALISLCRAELLSAGGLP